MSPFDEHRKNVECPRCGDAWTGGHVCEPAREIRKGAFCFDARGWFKSPEMAAFHAIAIQGGFTTARHEAERMTRERGDGPEQVHYREMGRVWLQTHPFGDGG